jgi:tRNA 2-thiouridine synthesizing protein A
MKTDHTLDCVGLYCPMPIVNTNAEMKRIKVGEVLEVLSDDKGIVKDMPAWCKATGHEFVGSEEDKGQFKVYVKKMHN